MLLITLSYWLPYLLVVLLLLTVLAVLSVGDAEWELGSVFFALGNMAVCIVVFLMFEEFMLMWRRPEADASCKLVLVKTSPLWTDEDWKYVDFLKYWLRPRD